MMPDRKVIVNKKLIEEYYWGGKMVVYIDHFSSDLTYDDAVSAERLKEEKE